MRVHVLNVLTLLAFAAAIDLPTLAASDTIQPTAGGCACDIYSAPNCIEARDEFVCMSGCIQRGYVFPQCGSVMSCCVYIQSTNRGVECVDEGADVRFDCSGPTPGLAPLARHLAK
jgi:hypothetical protein